MELDDFAKEFSERVLATAAADGNFSRSAFTETALAFLEEAGQIVEYVPCYFKGTGLQRRALEMDAYAFDDVDESLALFVADYHNFDASERITRSDATKLFARMVAVLDEAMTGRLNATIEDSHPAFAFGLQLRRQFTNVTRIRLYLLTDALMSEQIKDLPEKNLLGKPCEFNIWDMARFHRSQESPTGRDELEVDFSSLVPGGLPCLAASIDSPDYRAYRSIVPVY